MANELELGSGLLLTNPAPADAYYTLPQDGSDPAMPYESVAQACQRIPREVRYMGMAVAVLVNGEAVRHAWKAGTADDQLVPDGGASNDGSPFVVEYQDVDGTIRRVGYTLFAAAVATLPADVPATLRVFPGRTVLPSGGLGHFVNADVTLAQREVTLYLEPGTVLEMPSAKAIYVNNYLQFSQAPAKVTIEGPGRLIAGIGLLGNSGATQLRVNCRWEGYFAANYYAIPAGAAADQVTLGPGCHLRTPAGSPIRLLTGNATFYGAPIALTLDRARVEAVDGSAIMVYQLPASANDYGSTLKVIDSVLSPALVELVGFATTYQAATPGGTGGDGGGGPAPDLSNYYTKAQADALFLTEAEADARYLTAAGLRLVLPPGQANASGVISADEAGTFTGYELTGAGGWLLSINGGPYNNPMPLTLAAGDTISLALSGRTAGEGILKLKP